MAASAATARPALPAFAEALLAALAAGPSALGADLGPRAAPGGPAGTAAGPRPGVRAAAVLVLIGPGRDGRGDVVLLERAAGLRSHPGQVAFPGGVLDPADGGDPVVAALREAAEEVGLVPADVRVLGALPLLHVAPLGFTVTPVLAWQDAGEGTGEDAAAPLAPGDPGEVARVLRAPLAALADPAARVSVRAPNGWVGPAFLLEDLVVWGFTAALLSGLLRGAGLEQPWDAGRVVALPARFAGLAGPGPVPGPDPAPVPT